MFPPPALNLISKTAPFCSVVVVVMYSSSLSGRYAICCACSGPHHAGETEGYCASYTAAAPLAAVCPWIVPAALASSVAAGYGASQVNDKMLRDEWTRITLALNNAFFLFSK